MDSFLDRRLDQIPFLVMDLETTGFIPGKDRVVEICAVVCVPGGAPRVALDSLVNPGIPVTGSDIHGIVDHDVETAPFLPEVGRALQPLAANRWLAGHNRSFDHGFLAREQVFPPDLPGLCTLELFKLLLGQRRSLDRACAHFGVAFDQQRHSARGDAMATALLLRKLISTCLRRGIETPRQLIGTFPSLGPQLGGQPLKAPRSLATPQQVKAKPRNGVATTKPVTGLRRYLDSALAALSDFRIDPEEKVFLAQLASELGLSSGNLRAAHARIFGVFLNRYTEDQSLDSRESHNLADVYACLLDLGWAPGQPVAKETEGQTRTGNLAKTSRFSLGESQESRSAPTAQ